MSATTKLDVRTVLQWLTLGVLAFIGISLLGVIADVASAVLSFALKAGVIVLIALLIIRGVDELRD